MTKQKIEVLESLRGIAATCVALYHFPASNYITDIAFIKNSDLMVDLFFVISGFVIALNYSDKIIDRQSLIAFQKRRFWRLYPLHFATLMVFIGFELIRFLAAMFAPSIQASRAFENSDPFHLLLHTLLLHGVGTEKLTFNYPSWSISSEFIIYFIFGLLLLIAKNSHKALFIIVFFIMRNVI